MFYRIISVLMIVGNGLMAQNHNLEGIWKDKEDKTCLIIKGNKVQEFRFISENILVKSKYKIHFISSEEFKLNLISSKSNSFPLRKGLIYTIRCRQSDQSDFFHCVITDNSNGSNKEIEKLTFYKIENGELENYLNKFDNAFKSTLVSNWVIPQKVSDSKNISVNKSPLQ